MNDHGITKDNLLATLPQALKQDPTVSALAEAIADVLARRPAEIDRLRIYPAIDQLDESLLDILAQDFKVDWWDLDYSLEEKRRTLRDNWKVRRSLGTPSAVVTAISAIYQGTTLEEWFQYGGEPYHFRLRIDLTGDKGDPERMRRVLDRIEFYKSLRSHLDSVDYSAHVGPFPFHTESSFCLLSLAIPLRFTSYGGGFIVLDGRRRLDGTWKLGQAASGVRMIHSAYRTVLLEHDMFHVTGWRWGLAARIAQRMEAASLDVHFGQPWENQDGLLLPRIQTKTVCQEEQTIRTRLVWRGAGCSNPQSVQHQSTEVHGTFQASEGLSTPVLHIKARAQTKERFNGALTHSQMWTFDGTYRWDGTRKFNAGITQEEL